MDDKNLTYCAIKRFAVFLVALVFPGLIMLSSCQTLPSPPPDPKTELIEKGKEIFFNETFDGNGRTCGSCHPFENNFTIDPAFIATLPDNDPLFVAEFNPNLKENFENPRLMREFALILENLDGFDDLENKFTMRGVPHVLGLPTSVDSAQGPRTGWSGDGAPGDGSLRAFATGAVIQHFTKTLNRIPGVDFRLPTDEELDALEAFQFSLGRQQDLDLPLPLKGTVAKRGQELFLNPTTGKCFACHSNAGANGDPNVFGPGVGNLNFDTGVENLPDQPADLTGEKVPPDDGFGIPGDGTFNTPPVVEAADTGPFFHNNSVETIEGAVAFYNGDAFNNSPAGQLIQGATGSGINLDGTQVVEVAAFLRLINAIENIRESIAQLESSLQRRSGEAMERLDQALAETIDSITVLRGGGLHPDAVAQLKEAKRKIKRAARSLFFRSKHTKNAIAELEKARALLVES
jgi:cytochrome c peroxidase